MPGAPWDFTIPKNEHWGDSFTWTNGSGTAFDLTDYTAKMEIRRMPGATVVLLLTTENARLILTPLEGKVSFSVPVSVLDTIPAGNYDYDLVLFDALGVPDVLLKGTVLFTNGVTDVI